MLKIRSLYSSFKCFYEIEIRKCILLRTASCPSDCSVPCASLRRHSRAHLAVPCGQVTKPHQETAVEGVYAIMGSLHLLTPSSQRRCDFAPTMQINGSPRRMAEPLEERNLGPQRSLCSSAWYTQFSLDTKEK